MRANIPHHVAIIMDGNARWAAKHGLATADGHRAGYRKIESVVKLLSMKGVGTCTLFAFSTENWDRPDAEVNAIMELANEAVEFGTDELHRNGVRLRHVGDETRLPASMVDRIREVERLTIANTGISLNLAFDYGGRHEIANAVRRIIDDGVPSEKVDESLIERYLFTSGIPDPDIIVRTGGEFRLSNFMLWQSAYAEFHATPTLWPDFDERDVDEAIATYSSRHRRFGRRSTQ